MDWDLEPSVIPGRTRGQMEEYRETPEPVCSCDICDDVYEISLCIKYDGVVHCPFCADKYLDLCQGCGQYKLKEGHCCD